jgi:hypothetical protein
MICYIWDIILVYGVLLIIQVPVYILLAYYPCKKKSCWWLITNVGNNMILLGNVRGRQKSQTIDVNNKQKLCMYYMYCI